MEYKKYIKKSLKVLAWIVGSAIALFLLIVLLIQVPYVQNKIKDRAVSYLEGKIKTKVVLGHIEIGLPKKVILENFYFEDQKHDTLAAGEKIAVDISLLKLLSNEIEINSIDLKGITANIVRNKDSVFNFDYIVKAFASKEKKKDTSAPMKITLRKVSLDRIRVKFDDAITKNDLKANIHHFDTRIDKFDLNTLDFDVPKITLEGLKLRLKQGELVREIAVNTRAVADSLAQQPNLKLKLGTIDLSKIDIAYDNEGTKLNTGLALGKLLVRVNIMDIKNQNIDLESLDIKGLNGGLTIGKFEKKLASKVVGAEIVPEAAPGKKWKFRLNQADMKNIAFRFDDENAVRVKKGIDYKHMNLKHVNMVGEKFVSDGEVMSGNIYAFTVSDQSGLEIQSLKTEFYYGPKSAYLKKLYLKTPQTLLKDRVVVSYPSLGSISKNIGDLAVNANLEGSHIGFKDILIFVPNLANTNPFHSNPEAIMVIDSRITGKVSDLEIPKLRISGIGNTSLAASGRVTGLPDVKKAYFDLTIQHFQTTSRDISGFVPKGTLPSSIRLPASFAADGTFRGTINNFMTDLRLASSYGSAKIKAQFDQTRRKAERYNADVQLNNFNVGQLIKNDSLGRITLAMKVNGVGLDPKTANATLKGKLAKAEFNKYTYRNLDLNGSIRHGQFVAKATMNDPNLAFALDSNGDFGGKYPAVKLELNLDIADLEKLNLHAGPMKLRGKMDADFPTADPDYLNGKLSLHNIMIGNKDGEFVLDSINVAASATAEKTSIALNSQFIDAGIDGKFRLTKIGTAISNTISKYYNTKPKSNKAKTEPQQAVFNLRVKNSKVLMQLVPEIKALDSIVVAGRYNSVNDTLMVNARIPRLTYGENTISNAVADIKTENDSLKYNVMVDDIQNPSIRLPYTNLSGSVKDNVVNYKLQLRDLTDKERYYIAGVMKSSDGDTEIHLIPDGLRLNYDNWTINNDNLLRFGKGVYANNFELSKDNASIKLQSQSGSPNAPLAVDFRDFKIETITAMAQQDSLAIGGRINGNALLKNLTGSPLFTADMKIDTFTYKKDTIGDIMIKVNNEVANTYNANVEITGNGNQVNLDGKYNAGKSSFDFVLDMKHMNLVSIQPFTAGNLSQSTGFISGKMMVSGTAKNPKVIGKLKFNDGAFKVTKINTGFKLLNDEIAFTDSGIVFEKFSLSDENNNPLRIRGSIDTPDYQNFKFNLDINAANFRAINSKEKDSDIVYGELYLDTALKIRGDMNKPVISGNLKVNKDTKVTLVLPQNDPAAEDREGIVEFIDRDNPGIQKVKIANDSISKTPFRGMDANVNIEIDKDAELSIIIDKGNGDYLKLKGEARLNGGIDPSGKTTLTGRYEFTEGEYEMTFNLIKRKFNIKNGSYILWTGEPMLADISITAVYKSDTAPIDLVEDQLGGVSPETRNTYKQRIPFETNLIMKGELLKPGITFDIQLPEGNNNVSTEVINTTEAKLAQLRQNPNELNKQVFALLLLNRFIGENPFASEAGGTSTESLARQSASKILSQQLNNLAADLIKGVELNFDLDSQDDYTSGNRETRTDLNVGVSKTLLDDRLKVTVGSSFGLEGTEQAGRETNNIAGDLSADYQLTKDGRYKVRAYRKNQYQVALQGQVIETGVGFIITMDYNKFRELFHRTHPDKSSGATEFKSKDKKKQ